MPANSPAARQFSPTTRARLAAAAASADCHHQLSTFAAHQPAPSRSNVLQTAPTRTPAQNEPTKFLPPNVWQDVLREFHAIQGAAENPPRAADLLQPTPTCSNAHHDAPRRKTNPDPAPSSAPRRPRPLTPTQLRAARLWFDGHSNAAILQTLAISRHTLARWKRHPDFQAELRRLSDAAARATSTVG